MEQWLQERITQAEREERELIERSGQLQQQLAQAQSEILRLQGYQVAMKQALQVCTAPEVTAEELYAADHA